MASLERSYVHGTSLEPLAGWTVGQAFDAAVERGGDAPALVVCHQHIRWSWLQLAERVDATAACLLGAGLEPGDRIGIFAPNCAEWIVLQFATAKAGLVLVNINPAYRVQELAYSLELVGARALVSARRFKTSDYVGILRNLLPEIDGCEPGDLHAQRAPELRWVILLDEIGGQGEQVEQGEPPHQPGMLSWDQLRSLGRPEHRSRLEVLSRDLQFDDPINIQFTSGTTGTPKAATLSHHSIVNNARLTGDAMALGADDRLCIPVPMYHCFGMVLGTLACVTHGSTMVLPSAGFDAGASLKAVAAERCTALHGVPTMFIAELEHPEFSSFDLTSLRTGIMAGAPCPVELMHRVVEEMHLEQITIAYGMTETGPVSFQTSVDDRLERRVTTVGRVLPHTEVKIVDDEGRVVPVGAPGELLTRGYCVMREYWNDPQRTAEAVDAARWIHSGDVATLDGEGYCKIVGRTKDMLIRGGENIFPREIEESLYGHPKVEEVEVFGVPDAKYGEEICAWIKLREGEKATEEEIRDFCRERIAHFKIPRYIRFVDDFPMTVTGKVQKSRLREAMAAELGLTERRSA